ncbi:MAG: hypothetical protein GYB31_12660 [Bacteroidetes bacterium]|nr:hypothetical protein [Bacteroidota bacterium]
MKGNKPSKKKVPFPVGPELKNYLKLHNHIVDLPLKYEDLLRYNASIPLMSQEDEDTLWRTVFYPELEFAEINDALCQVYSLLKADGNRDALDHLDIERIDFCTFGNTKPFRIRIINRLNDNYDHFYVKRIDASRIYGLELENLLSPNWFTYLVDGSTLIEEHVAGIPGDDFMDSHIQQNKFEQTRIAKEFIKFNERCFVRLLGDMRSYNFVVDITPDIEGNQYRLRAIDFDQQSYEGWKSFYLPQYFKENNPIINLGIDNLNAATVKQYQLEERTLIALRAKSSLERLETLLGIMRRDPISTKEKVHKLRGELAYHHKNDSFLDLETMGDLVRNNIRLLLRKEFKQSFLEPEG